MITPLRIADAAGVVGIGNADTACRFAAGSLASTFQCRYRRFGLGPRV